MRLLGNILWHVPFCGFMSALCTFLCGLLLTVLVIPAPIGLGLMQLSKFMLAPFSFSMIDKSDLNMPQNPLWQAYSFIIRILYFPIGCFLAIVVAIQTGLLFLTIVGIPVALALVRALGTYFNPVGKVCVLTDPNLTTYR
jgi:Predicted membrane protein